MAKDYSKELWTSPKEELPPEFWTTAESVVHDPGLQLMLAEIQARFKKELGANAPTTAYMLAERTAANFIAQKQFEADGAFSNTRNHKEFSKMLISYIAELHKITMTQMAEDDKVTKMATAVFKSTENLPPEQAAMIRDAVMASLGDDIE